MGAQQLAGGIKGKGKGWILGFILLWINSFDVEL
jgi:hypothetical protein